MHAVIIIILILAVLLVIFTLQNSMDITINVFFWEIKEAPLALVLIGCIVIGYILALIYLYPRIWKLKKENKKLAKLNSKLEGQHVPGQVETKIPDNDADDSFFDG